MKKQPTQDSSHMSVTNKGQNMPNIDSSISLETHRLNFYDELDELIELAAEIGVDSEYSSRLIKVVEYLTDHRYVFAYAEYSEDCAQRTPKSVHNLLNKVFHYPDPKEYC